MNEKSRSILRFGFEQSMAGAFAVTNTFVLEKPIIRREYESGLLYPSAHMLGKMLADFAVQIVFPVIFVT